MLTTRTTTPLSRWMTVFWSALVVFWIYFLIVHVHALMAGTPDTYYREHEAGALLAGGSLFLALSFLVRRLTIRWTLLGVSILLLVFDAVAR